MGISEQYVPVTTKQFVDACAQQGVDLETRLRRVARDCPSWPAHMLASAAAEILREGDAATLANRVIEWPVYSEDDVSRIMQHIINQSVEPPNLDTPIRFPRQARQTANTCSAAEYGFASTLHSIQEGVVHSLSGYGGEIFVDENGAASIVVKGTGYSSGLGVTEVRIGDVTFNPGSLYYVDTKEHYQDYFALPPGWRVRPLSDITGISFARLSSFAVSPSQRQIADWPTEDMDTPARHLITNIATEELQPLVQTAVDTLGRI